MTDGPDNRSPEPAPAAANQTAAADAEKKRRKKKEKVRSAWISFVGRIVAQVVGAVATIVLGVLFLQKYGHNSPPGDRVPVESAPARAAARPTSDTSEKVLVVLPLASFSADPKEQYFADGMTEAVIASLAQIRSLRVISRTSAMQYKDTRKPLHEIARELNVDLALEGSIVREANRLRLTAQLIDARADGHLWARTYDRTTRDVLAVQAELAAEIAREVSAASSPGVVRAAPDTPVDPAGYDVYLKGREALHLRSPESLRAAEQHFQNALGRDSKFAPAAAGLAEVYALLGTSGYGNRTPQETMPQAQAAAKRAIELDPQSSDAHLALAYVQHLYQWDWALAEHTYQRALELNRNSSLANQRYAVFLAGMSRYDDAVAHARRAAELDPLSSNAFRTLGMVHYLGRRYPLAITAFQRAMSLDPQSLATHFMLAWSLTELGDFDAALRTCARAPRTGNRDQLLAAEAYAASKAGQASRATQIRTELRARGSAVAPSALIRVNSGIGDVNALLDAVSRAVDERADVITWLLADPVFDPIRADARFAGILRRVGLAVAAPPGPPGGAARPKIAPDE